MRLLPATPLLLALLAPLREAAAQSPPTGADVALQLTVAKTLMEEGKRLLEAGRFAQATEKLEASARTDPSPAALLLLGTCHEKLGASASAWGTFQRAAREARSRGEAARAAEATRRAAALEPRLTRVRVVVSAAGIEPEVIIDGRHALKKDAWGVPLPLDPGQHRLTASAPGKPGFSMAFELSREGEIKEVIVPDLGTRSPSEPRGPKVDKALLDEGRRLLVAGRYAEAMEKIEASLREDASPAALLVLGTCHEKLGATASAWKALRRAEERGRMEGDGAAAAEASKRAASMVPKLSKVNVVVAAGWPVPSVLLDGRHEIEKNEWGTPIPMDPGMHLIEAMAPGKRSFSTMFEVRAGDEMKTVIVPDLARMPESPPLPDPAKSPSPASRPTAPGADLAVATLGVVAIVHGVVGYGMVLDGEKRTELAGGILLGTAGASAIASVITWAVAKQRSRAVVGSRSVRLGPFVARGSGGGAFQATW